MIAHRGRLAHLEAHLTSRGSPVRSTSTVASLLVSAVGWIYLVGKAREVLARSRSLPENATPAERKSLRLAQWRLLAVGAFLADCLLGLMFLALDVPLAALAFLVLMPVLFLATIVLSFMVGLRGA